MANKAIILGRLGKDPVVRYMPDGTATASFSVATSERFKDKNDEWQERAEWHNVVFYGRSAEVAGEYLRKGRQVYIEGKLRTRKWTDKDGQERYTTEIVGDRLELVGSKQADAESEHPAPVQDQPQGGGGGGDTVPTEDFDDEIPFITKTDIRRDGHVLPRVRF